MSSKIDFNAKTVMHYTIMILIMAAFYILPAPSEVITPYGMKIMGVFLALVYGWTFIGMLLPSLIGIFGMAFAGYGTLEFSLVALFSDSTVLLMIIGMLAFDALRQTNASDYMLAKILTSKIAKKGAMFAVLAIYGLMYILGFMGMSVLVKFILFPMMNDFLKKCGYQKGDKFCTFFLMGFLISMLLPISLLPFYSWGLMVAGSLGSMAQYTVPVGWFITLQLIIDMAFILTWPLVMKVFGCDFGKLENVDIVSVFNVKEGQKMTTAQKIALGGMLIFIVLVAVGSFATGGLVKASFKMIGVAGLMIAYWVAMALIKIDGKPILNTREAAGTISWDLFFLMAIALEISSVLTSAETGIGTWIAQLVAPVVSSFGSVTFIVILTLVLFVLTNIANNIAVVFTLLNVIVAVYKTGIMEMNFLVIAIILCISSSAVAFFTPASSNPGAVLHAGDMIDPKQVSIYNWVAVGWLFIIMMVVLIPVAMLGVGM